MRHGSALLLLSTLTLIGCTSEKPVRSGSWFDRLLQPAGPTGPEAVQMDVALLERPLGDPYINRDLWDAADEQVIPLESRGILEDNGFRIGQIGGITPARLQALLTSERSCVNPRRIRTLAGRPSKLVLGPEMECCECRVQGEGSPVSIQLDRALCTFEVVPTLTADRRTRLRFVPQVLHGAANLKPCPASDQSGWMLKEERPAERYAQLAFEVSLAPNEYVVIGGRFDKPETLGHRCFLRAGETPPVQRILVIRTARDPGSPSDPPFPDEPISVRSPPLAFRAGMTARGSSR
jgi:hypothetical protein